MKVLRSILLRPVTVLFLILTVVSRHGSVAVAIDVASQNEPIAVAQLADAAESKDWPVVEQMLKEGLSTSTAQPDGMTALHWAVYHNSTRAVRLLIDSECNVNAVTRYQISPLYIACHLGHAAAAELLIAAGADVNAALSGGETMLMVACRTGNPDVVRHLVRARAGVNARERRGQTALMWAAAEGHADVVDLLLTSGADPDVSTAKGFTALMFAAREGRRDVVSRLLSAGVEVNSVMNPRSRGNRAPRAGTSALQMAVESGHFELALFLVQKGADPNDQRSGFTPLHAMSWVRKPDRGENEKGDPSPRGSGKVTSLDFVRELVRAGADVNARLRKGAGGRAVLNRRGATPFLLAAKTADLPLLKMLLELGADPTIPNADGCTPIMAAAGIGVRAVGEEAGTEPEVLKTIDFLVELGADVNAKDKNGETAMHGAAYRNYPQVVRSLSEHGADPAVWNQKNKYGWTPEMIASGKRPGSFKPSPETIHALREVMADLTD